ncbi:MAG TPA: hypothetical protein VGQ11_04925 [Candidatus Acidoferrales bacterium]|nr:hypothetical protein [Candidatus Acidoferrales bacterium]
MKNRYVLGAIVVAVLLAGYLLFRPTLPPVREQAHVAERKATVWNRLAMVREPLATLRYGDSVGIVESKQWNGVEYSRVVALGRSVGWMESRQLMPEALWDRAADNLKKSRALKPQARGITKVPTNVRVEPGRSSQRFFQLSRDAPVEIFSRAVVELPPESAAAKKTEEQTGDAPAEPRREDWVFIRGHDADAGDLAGWVLGRFLEPDLPAPLRDYAAGIRFVAWFELSRVLAETPEGAEKEKKRGVAQARSEGMPQFLAAGTVGPEGQACDFTLLRYYTWHATRHRYETAYVESDLCGRLPIQVSPIPAGANLEKSEASFSFTALATAKHGSAATAGTWEPREYRMKQNIIRRIRAKK